MDLMRLHLTWAKQGTVGKGWQEYEVTNDPSLPPIDTVLVRCPSDHSYPETMEILVMYDPSDQPREERPCSALLTSYGGAKINAIKTVREHTGWGLKESKDFVEDLPRRIRTDDLPAEKLKSLVASFLAFGGAAMFCGGGDCTKCNERFRCYTNR